MAHHPDPAYADYFAAGGVTTTIVPEVDAGGGDPHHLRGVHQPGAEAFGVRGLVVPAEMAAAAAHGKAALGGGHFVELSAHAHRQQGHNHAPLTSLSLHQQHQLAGGAHRQYQAWPQQGAWNLRGSRFLLPTQQLLQEFCSLPVETTRPAASKPPANENGGAGSSSSAPSAQIQAMDAAELNRLKAKLYTMLDEVDRRYRRYREQMRAVAGSFEAVAGAQAATAYTRLALRTVSRHFRTLRDGLAAQVEAVRRALGEKDTAGLARAGAAKGETTPRLRALDQCLRQHRAYQSGVMESQPWRPQRGLPERAVSILRAWLFEHFLHPYPSDVDKHILARQTGLSRSQVSNWFINARVRLWKPMVEEMYAEEMKEPEEGDSSNANNSTNPSYASKGQGRGGSVNGEDGGGGEGKPTRAQLVLHDAGSLASVVSIGSRDQQNLSFGVMDDHLGFGAYDGHATAGGQAGFGGGGGGVSLTLGLQQHVDPHGGVNVAFAAAPAAAHEFMFMAGGEQQMVAGGGIYSSGHQFGDNIEGDTVSASKTNYHRGLSASGFQLLHDLAG